MGGVFDNELSAAISGGRCPDCSGPVEDFLQGPRGGLAVNVCCPHCWSAFNVVRYHGDVVGAQRIPAHYWRNEPGFGRQPN